jgi:hypothetical protein
MEHQVLVSDRESHYFGLPAFRCVTTQKRLVSEADEHVTTGTQKRLETGPHSKCMEKAPLALCTIY